jgi:hypothetical protein
MAMMKEKNMLKKIILSITLFLLPLLALAQNTEEIEWINKLDTKAIATFGDAKRLFYSTFPDLSKQQSNTIKLLNQYKDDAPLKRGMIAAIIARELNLKGSLFYMLTGLERYACRACIAEGIMSANSSENDLISGPELLDIMIQAKIAKEGN